MSRFKALILVCTTILILIFGIYYIHAKKELQKEQFEFQKFKKNSSSLVLLEKRWASKKDYKRIFIRIKNISSPSKETRVKNMKIFDFHSLSQANLKKIVKLLLNSHMIINKIDIKKINSKLSLHVEVRL